MKNVSLSTGAVLRIWLPLAVTWAMMCVEGPYLTSFIARLPNAKTNLAAYGISFGLLLLCEAPILGLISGSIALVKDKESQRAFHRFSLMHCILTSLILALISVEPLNTLIVRAGLGVEDPLPELIQRSLMISIPIPFLVGMRRYYQGLLVTGNRSRLVILGTVVRLLCMAGTGLVLFEHSMNGVELAAWSLLAGIAAETAMAFRLSRKTSRELDAVLSHETPSQRAIAAFYYPFALSTLVAIAINPTVSIFLAKAPLPLESLAVFPVVGSLTLMFRSVAFAFQEAAVAALSAGVGNLASTRRAGWVVAGISTSALALIALSPLATWWFRDVSGLPVDLVPLAEVTAALTCITPALAVWICFERGAFVVSKRTSIITFSGVVELCTLVALLFAGTWISVAGAVSASCALVAAAILSGVYLSGMRRRN